MATKVTTWILFGFDVLFVTKIIRIEV